MKNKQSAFVTMSSDQKLENTFEMSLTSQAIQRMIQDSMQSTLPRVLSFVFSVAGLSGIGIKPTLWFIDSTAFNHMTNKKHKFVDLKPYSLNQSITAANGTKLPIQGIGIVCLSNNSSQSICLPSSLYVPRLITNLIYVGQLTD